MKTKFTFIAVIVSILFVFIGQVAVAQSNHNENGFQLMPNEIRLVEGQSAMIKALYGRKSIDARNVAWSIADTSIASISKFGKITTQSAGETKVMGVFETDTAFVKLQVKVNERLGKLFIAPAKIELRIGESYKVYPVIDRKRVNDSLLVWESMNDSIVSINSKGQLNAKLEGLSKIMAVYNGDTAYCQVEVKARKIDQPKQKVKVLEIDEMKALFERFDTIPANIYIEISDTSVLSIDENYNLKAIAIGEATVQIFKDSTLKYSFNVLVVDEGVRAAVADSIKRAGDRGIRIKFNHKIRKKHNKINLRDSIKIEVIADSSVTEGNATVYTEKLASVAYAVVSAEISEDGQEIVVELNQTPKAGEVLLFSLAAGVIDENDETVTFDLVLIGENQVATSIAKVANANSNIELFPNPSSTGAIQIKATNEIRFVSIYSITGSMMQKQAFNSNQISVNTNNLPKGMYTVIVEFDKGNNSSKKLILK